MHFLLVTVGTDGDVFPYVAIGAELRSRGHRITLVTNEHYRGIATDHGFGFEPLVTSAETHSMLADPDLWHPLKCALVGIRWGGALIPRHYELLESLSRDIDVAMIASPGVMAARMVQEKHGRPICSLILQPWMIPSADAPPTMAAWSLPRWAPRPLASLYFRGLDAVGDLLIGKFLNPFRDSIDLPPVKRVFRWWISPELILGLFPAWYGPPQNDWPPQLELTGFPMYDGSADSALSTELEEYCGSADPPIAFTFGTGMMHAARLFRLGLEACERIGKRALLLTRHEHQLPDPIPSFACHVPYAPFQHLFPRCAAVVHHGGVGTTAKSLAAGTPQVILPFAFDQVDNGTRIQRLGAGEWIRQNKLDVDRLSRMLESVLGAPTAKRCSELREQSAKKGGIARASQLIEDWVRSSRSSPLSR